MGRLKFILLSALLAALVVATPTHGQYMYLDANGDGMNTSADRLTPNGEDTEVRIYLETSRSIDGVPAYCNSPTESLTINSYEVILHATGGEVVFSNFQNLQAAMTTPFGLRSSATEFYAGMGGGLALPPGLYLLAIVLVTGQVGQPSLSIASSTPLYAAAMTSFGTRCPGVREDNTYSLGTDWFSVGGLASFDGGALSADSVVPSTLDARVGEPTVIVGEFTSTSSTAIGAHGLPPGFRSVLGEPFGGRRQLRAYGAIPSGESWGSSHTLEWVVGEASRQDTLSTTIRTLPPPDRPNMDQELNELLTRRSIHGVSLAPVRRFGAACLPRLMAYLRDGSKRKTWARATTAIGLMGDTAYFDSLHAYIWNWFRGTVDDATYMAAARAQESLGPIATASTRAEDYLVSGCSPDFWHSVPWRPSGRTEFQFSTYMSKMSILALGYCDTDRAASYLAALEANPLSPTQAIVIQAAIQRNRRVRQIGIVATEVEDARKPRY